jgi:hypothetical protein
MDEPDPRDHWTEPTEITVVSFSGTLVFSCCRQVHTFQGENRAEVQCPVCGTLYGLALLVRLQAADDYRFPKGTRVRPTARLEVRAGSSTVVLEPSQVYEAAQDTHGVLNVPAGHQPVLVHVQGDRGKRPLIANVPQDLLEMAE